MNLTLGRMKLFMIDAQSTLLSRPFQKADTKQRGQTSKQHR